MPAQYALSTDHDLAAVGLVGRVDGGDLVRVIKALHGDPRWRPGLDTVWDGGAVTEFDLDPAGLEAVADLRFRSTGTLAGRGVIVARREVDTDTASLFRAIARKRGKEAHVAGSVREALDVLGLEAAVWDALTWTPVPDPDGGP